jgi:Arc/MetJ-type ribon-helix-helix transcriptional regulator
VEGGDYASSSEVVREAIRDWKIKRALQPTAFESLKDRHRQGPRRSGRRPGQGFRHSPDHRTPEEAVSRPLALRLTETAEDDLAEIWAYVAAEASDAVAPA